MSLFGSSQPQQTSSLFGSSQSQQTSSLLGSSQPQQSSSIFGSAQSNQTQKPNLFGSLNTNTNSFGQASSAASAPATQAPSGGSLFDRITPAPAKPATSLFGAPAQSPAQQTGGSLFGSAGQQNQQQQTQGSSLFGNAGQQNQQPQTQGSSLFGALGGNTQQSSGTNTNTLGGSTLFGGGSSLFGGNTGQQNQKQGSGLFGANTGQQNQQQGNSLFGTNTSRPSQQQGSSLFGTNTGQQNQQQGSNLFGTNIGQQNQQPGGSLFGGFGSTTQQPNQPQPAQQQGSSLFGTLGQSMQQQQQPQSSQSGVLGQLSLGLSQNAYPRQKTVMEQMELAYLKWHPLAPQTLFQTYLYNAIDPDLAPFYGPTARDDETKWEEALRNKPSPGTIPIAVRGFFELGKRAVGQKQHLDILNGRLVEIQDGLQLLMRKHDIEFTTRTEECRRKHLRLSARCLSLAARTQVLRNRGYALDNSEEELRKKLLTLEHSVFDPALSGRGEEIWARMVTIRERGRLLEREMKMAGQVVEQGQQGGEIDAAVMKRCREVSLLCTHDLSL